MMQTMELDGQETVRLYLGGGDGGSGTGRGRSTTTQLMFGKYMKPVPINILDPESEIVLMWNRVFIVSGLVALFIDPLYFYLPSIRGDEKNWCVNTDVTLGIVVTIFRSIIDFFFLVHIVMKFKTAYVSPNSHVFGRGVLVRDPNKIALRYLRSDFFVDLIAALPLPQLIIWFVIPAIGSPETHQRIYALALVVFLQNMPRLYLIFPLGSQILKATGVLAQRAWAGAAYNLLLYILASHVLGATWYLISFDRYTFCWKSICRREKIPNECLLVYLNCDQFHHPGHAAWVNSTRVFSTCDPNLSTTTFKYGLFVNAIVQDVVFDHFFGKCFYCLWWGLQQLSSYGQNLQTSTFIWETLFSIFIAICGLVLFAQLIGNMQTYLQSLSQRLEEWRLQRKDTVQTEEWLAHRHLPEDLKHRVRRFIQYKWLATRGVDEDAILHSLPTDLRRDIHRHFFLDLVKRVPLFSRMDNQLLDAICGRLVSSLSTQGTYIVREGDPVTEMLFIRRGRLNSSTTNGGRSGFFNMSTLCPGDFCGEELLAWALDPKSAGNLPPSTRTVKAVVEVEAFALRAEDLKFIAGQIRKLYSKELQHTFRYHSLQWRTWAACYIQAAWRMYMRRKLAKELAAAESFTSDERVAVEDSDDDLC
ncbi:putative cyclic nucleotide-gated ion channel 14 [Drosera capensis]